jgi:PAS domain S-box-containing protein
MDDTGAISGWNLQAEVVFGWPAAEVLGRRLDEIIIPQEFREKHRQGLARFLATGEGPILNRRIELTALHREGHEFQVELSVTPIRQGNSWLLSAFVP